MFLSVFVTSFVWIILGGLVAVIRILGLRSYNRQHFIDVCLRSTTGGKPQVDMQKGRLYTSKRFGNYIYISKRKIPIPRIDQEAFLPTRKSGRMFLDVTSSDGYYYVNKYNPIKRRLVKDFVLSDEEGKKYSFNNKAELQKFLKDKYKVVDYENIGGVVNPVPHTHRSQALQNDLIIQHLNKEDLSFWKSPQFIWVATLAFACTLAIVIIVLSMQHGVDLSGGSGNGGLINNVANNIGNTSKPPTP